MLMMAIAGIVGTGASSYISRCLGEKDYEKAISLYEKSASLGNVTALSNLGYCYYYGRSIPVDKEKAKLEKYTQMMEQVKERLEALKAGR